ncbi:MAG: hypothetical protein HY870_04370 [Chloroflexi bacterium]|nr:hypothetical protein [Chloroflexota bacterium]
MSAPLQKGEYHSSVDDIKEQKPIYDYRDWVTTANATAWNVEEATPQSANGVEETPTLADLNQMVDASALPSGDKSSIKQTLAHIQSAIIQRDDLDWDTLKDGLTSVGAKLPALQPRLKLWIEHVPGAQESVQSLVRILYK